MAAEIVPRDDFLILYRAKKAIRRSINMRKVNITETVLRDEMCIRDRCATVAQPRLSQLIDAIGGAFGLVLGMTGAAALVLLVSLVSAIMAVIP